MQPDALLCALAERGNEDAFGILHTRYRQQVFAFVYHLLGRPGSVDDAEDLTQEIMQKAYAHLNTRRSGGSFKAWLFRIARNHTFDHIRARKPSSVSLDDADLGVEPSNVVSLHSQVEHRADLAWLLGALGALPERQRQALVMRELGGQSVDEIADCLETTPESAKQLIKRGRAAVTTAAEQGGVRSHKLGRDLAAAAPITAIAWLGAGKASAAGAGAAVAGANAAGGAAAAGTAAAGTAAAGTTAGGVAAGAGGLALVSGKVAATVLAVAAIGAGGVVVGEQAITGDEPAAQQTGAAGSGPAVPAQSLVVGEKAAEQAVANKKLANERRERARERAAAKKKAKAKAKAKAQRAKRAKANAGKSTSRGNKGGNSDSTSTGGKPSGSGNSQSTTSPSQGSGNSSAGSDSGGSANGGGSNSSGGGNGKGKPTE